MKKILCLILLMTFLETHAQPGDKFGFHRMDQVNRLSDSIVKYPDNYEYRWVRLELMFAPYFNLYTKPEVKSEEKSIIESFQNLELLSYNQINIEEELNRFISNNVELEIDPIDYPYYGVSPDGNKVTQSHIFYKRGQYYYAKGAIDKALEDYFKALSLNPKEYLKKRICISISAYYFNLESEASQKNLEEALTYLDMVTPVKYELEPRTITEIGDRNYDEFEKEKILLLIETKAEERLFNYVKNLAKSHLNFYFHQISNHEVDHNSYSVQSSLERGIRYLNDLFKYVEQFENPEKYWAELGALLEKL